MVVELEFSKIKAQWNLVTRIRDLFCLAVPLGSFHSNEGHDNSLRLCALWQHAQSAFTHTGHHPEERLPRC